MQSFCSVFLPYATQTFLHVSLCKNYILVSFKFPSMYAYLWTQDTSSVRNTKRYFHCHYQDTNGTMSPWRQYKISRNGGDSFGSSRVLRECVKEPKRQMDVGLLIPHRSKSSHPAAQRPLQKFSFLVCYQVSRILKEVSRTVTSQECSVAHCSDAVTPPS